MRRDNPAPVRRHHDTEQDNSYAFRRSRTITGSAATSVRAAGEERGQLRSPRLHEHSLRKHRRKLGAYLFLTLIGAGGLWYVITSYIGDSVTVGTFSVQSTSRSLDSDRYQRLVSQYLHERPLERFEFALNETAFSQFIVSHAPEVSAARLTTGDSLGSGQLSVRLREPVASWTIKNQQYFVDAEGSAFTTNYFAVPTVVVADKSGINADAGVVASTKLLRFIGRVVTLVNQAAIAPVEAVTLPQGSTREVDLKLRDHTYDIKAHVDRDPAGQAADIVNAVRYIERKGIQPKYLDVRISSKAYYRD